MPIPDAQAILSAFEKKYPFIKTTSYRATGPALVSRIQTEQRAGTHIWDTMNSTGFEPYVLLEQGYFAKYVLSSMLASLRTNPAWDARAAQTAGQYAQQAMQISNAVTQAAIAHARQQAALGSVGGWNHPNSASLPKVTRDPASERNRDNANRGTRQVCDDLGTCKTVDNAWQNVWRDHNGNVVPGSASGYPPDYSGQWTKMQ